MPCCLCRGSGARTLCLQAELEPGLEDEVKIRRGKPQRRQHPTQRHGVSKAHARSQEEKLTASRSKTQTSKGARQEWKGGKTVLEANSTQLPGGPGVGSQGLPPGPKQALLFSCKRKWPGGLWTRCPDFPGESRTPRSTSLLCCWQQIHLF